MNTHPVYSIASVRMTLFILCPRTRQPRSTLPLSLKWGLVINPKSSSRHSGRGCETQVCVMTGTRPRCEIHKRRHPHRCDAEPHRCVASPKERGVFEEMKRLQGKMYRVSFVHRIVIFIDIFAEPESGHFISLVPTTCVPVPVVV